MDIRVSLSVDELNDENFMDNLIGALEDALDEERHIELEGINISYSSLEEIYLTLFGEDGLSDDERDGFLEKLYALLHAARVNFLKYQDDLIIDVIKGRVLFYRLNASLDDVIAEILSSLPPPLEGLSELPCVRECVAGLVRKKYRVYYNAEDKSGVPGILLIRKRKEG